MLDKEISNIAQYSEKFLALIALRWIVVYLKKFFQRGKKQGKFLHMKLLVHFSTEMLDG